MRDAKCPVPATDSAAVVLENGRSPPSHSSRPPSGNGSPLEATFGWLLFLTSPMDLSFELRPGYLRAEARRRESVEETKVAHGRLLEELAKHRVSRVLAVLN